MLTSVLRYNFTTDLDFIVVFLYLVYCLEGTKALLFHHLSDSIEVGWVILKGYVRDNG